MQTIFPSSEAPTETVSLGTHIFKTVANFAAGAGMGASSAIAAGLLAGSVTATLPVILPVAMFGGAAICALGYIFGGEKGAVFARTAVQTVSYLFPLMIGFHIWGDVARHGVAYAPGFEYLISEAKFNAVVGGMIGIFSGIEAAKKYSQRLRGTASPQPA